LVEVANDFGLTAVDYDGLVISGRQLNLRRCTALTGKRDESIARQNIDVVPRQIVRA
jgi:hypothetical protein